MTTRHRKNNHRQKRRGFTLMEVLLVMAILVIMGTLVVTTFAGIFPVRHFSLALQTAFNPFETGAGFELVHLLVLAGWMVGGLLVAVRFFSWEPRR